MRFNRQQAESASFLHVLRCFLGGLAGPDVGPCCDVLNVGYLVEGAKNYATVDECRDQAEERRDSVRSVRGIPLVCGLEDLSKAAVLHRVQGLDRVEVFGEKRAGAGCLLCVGDLKGFCQSHQTLDCLVVGFADLLGLVASIALKIWRRVASVAACWLFTLVMFVSPFWKKV